VSGVYIGEAGGCFRRVTSGVWTKGLFELPLRANKRSCDEAPLQYCRALCYPVRVLHRSW
jgi:hypothetical protein